MNEMQNKQLSGSKNVQSIGVHASNNVTSDSEQDDYPLRISNMSEINNPSKLFHQNELDLDETMISNEDFEEEDYHREITKKPSKMMKTPKKSTN